MRILVCLKFRHAAGVATYETAKTPVDTGFGRTFFLLSHPRKTDILNKLFYLPADQTVRGMAAALSPE